ncbi:MAG: phosphodiester glycosidase family protein, partial [Chitinispirillaceae bacterium]|nr:phosphodiester glycosidase family protein [Chitinispirillaceae bacterium]
MIHKSTIQKIVKAALFVGIAATVSRGVAAPPASPWTRIDEGLFSAEFGVKGKNTSGDSGITVVRIDPKRYVLRLLTASETGDENMTVREWATKYRLLGAINAGMYLTDYATNCGYMKNFTHLNNPRINKTYFSVAAFNPVDPQSPPFRIFDADRSNMRTIIASYNTVIQNLRLVKRPGVNRWEQQEKKWSEVALGEDADGNVLFIFCREPMSMHDLNDRLLSLPINLVCGQHCEGGPEASLYLRHNGVEILRNGRYESGFAGNDGAPAFLPLPNVIGVVKRSLLLPAARPTPISVSRSAHRHPAEAP